MKVLGFIVNIFLPGIGTMVVGKVGTGILQFLLVLVAAFLTATALLSITFLTATALLSIIGIPLGIGVWIWAMVSAATSLDKPVQVVVLRE